LQCTFQNESDFPEAYWYNRRLLGGIEQLGNQKEVRDLQRDWSGIMLFRDDFRVFLTVTKRTIGWVWTGRP
jgi:hypothetical protein